MKSHTKDARDLKRLEAELEYALTMPLIGSPDYQPPRRRLPFSVGLVLGVAGSISILMLIGTIVGLLTGVEFK